MPPKKKMVAVSGSHREPLENARVIAAAAPDERLEVTVRLRPRRPLPDAKSLLAEAPGPQEILTHGEFDARYGADPKDMAVVRRFAKAHGLAIVRESAARRSIMLSGTVADFSKAFLVQLHVFAYAGGTYRGGAGPVRIPADLARVVEGVFGLDNRPVATRHLRLPRKTGAPTDGAKPFNPGDVARLYGFPTAANGSGETVGIIELGGGYRPADLASYFAGLGIPLPSVIPVSVDGGSNAPSGDPGSADAEVGLDIEVIGAVAPGAKIVVYFGPNDAASKGFLDALTKAVHDTTNNPSVISISWGGSEVGPDDAFQIQFDQVLQEAAMLGITVCVAAGDDGAADEGPKVWDGVAHVDFPSSSPFALACGGTRLIAGTGGATIKAESVWNQHAADASANDGPDGSFGASGGGVSQAFPLPAYQRAAHVPTSASAPAYAGRGVPDVTGAGDPDTGYNVLVDGQRFPVGGTSAVAPLWAGLVALINQTVKGRVGFVNPALYALSSKSGAFRDVTVGDNRVSYEKWQNVGYSAGPGWDAASGLGSPNGEVLSKLLLPATSAPGKPPHRHPPPKKPKKPRPRVTAKGSPRKSLAKRR